MKKILLFASAWMLGSLAVSGQTSENFNSRPGVELPQVKNHLQNHCWVLSGFNVNAGWTPNIEGDGGAIPENAIGTNGTSGIYSPVLEVPGFINISFKYRLSGSISGQERRWLKIYLLNSYNEIQSELDSIEITNPAHQHTYTHSRGYGAGSGMYKLFISYNGIGGDAKVAIDDLTISSSVYYLGGCNLAPVAANDVINGAANRSATGFICNNDFDPNNDLFDCYVVASSPHGTVTMNENKSFTFTPNAGFTGNSTTFTYQICDNGYGPLCSNTATVTINFPTAAMLPVSMIDFTGIYKNDGKVEVSWTTTFEQHSDRFEIERSLDGMKWETAGVVKAAGVSAVKKNYSYIDEVGRNTANKKDLYYRLKMVDADGKVSISRILVVRVYNTRSTKMISVTPNPAKNDIVATVQLNESSVVVFRVVNSAGAEVMRKSMKLSAGASTTVMEGTSKLKPGMYVLEVIVNSNERMMVKLIKE